MTCRGNKIWNVFQPGIAVNIELRSLRILHPFCKLLDLGGPSRLWDECEKCGYNSLVLYTEGFVETCTECSSIYA